MKLIAAHVFEARGIGRAAEESGEVLDPLHVVMLGLRRELADRHVFDHAPTQRADGLFGHGDAPVLMEVANPSSQDRTFPFATPVPLAADPYPAGVLVHCPNPAISQAAIRSPRRRGRAARAG